jgi:hypothetical protein
MAWIASIYLVSIMSCYYTKAGSTVSTNSGNHTYKDRVVNANVKTLRSLALAGAVCLVRPKVNTRFLGYCRLACPFSFLLAFVLSLFCSFNFARNRPSTLALDHANPRSIVLFRAFPRSFLYLLI